MRPALLAPLILASGLAMLYAPRGVEKTYLALSIAHAVVTGGILLRWHAPKARPVLYVDGERPAATLQARLSDILGGAEQAARLCSGRVPGGGVGSGHPGEPG